MVTSPTSSATDAGADRLNANKNAPRVVSPSMVIGLGSTSCQIVRRLEATSENWSFEDRKNLAFLYMDTREATRGEISRGSRFIPLILPHFSNLRDMRPWITECVPELKYLSLSREGALGTLANAGVAGRFNYSDIRGHLDSTIEQICPLLRGHHLPENPHRCLPRRRHRWLIAGAAGRPVRSSGHGLQLQRGAAPAACRSGECPATPRPPIRCNCGTPTPFCSSCAPSREWRSAGPSTPAPTRSILRFIPTRESRPSGRTLTYACCIARQRIPSRCSETTSREYLKTSSRTPGEPGRTGGRDSTRRCARPTTRKTPGSARLAPGKSAFLTGSSHRLPSSTSKPNGEVVCNRRG